MNNQAQEHLLLSDADLDAIAGGLEAQGLDVVVAATTTEVARPHAFSTYYPFPGFMGGVRIAAGDVNG